MSLQGYWFINTSMSLRKEHGECISPNPSLTHGGLWTTCNSALAVWSKHIQGAKNRHYHRSYLPHHSLCVANNCLSTSHHVTSNQSRVKCCWDAHQFWQGLQKAAMGVCLFNLSPWRWIRILGTKKSGEERRGGGGGKGDAITHVYTILHLQWLPNSREKKWFVQTKTQHYTALSSFSIGSHLIILNFIAGPSVTLSVEIYWA